MNTFIKKCFFLSFFLVTTIHARTLTIINHVIYPITVRQVTIRNGVDLTGQPLIVGAQTIDKAKNIGTVRGHNSLTIKKVSTNEISLTFIYMPDEQPDGQSVAPFKVSAGTQNVCIELTWPGKLDAHACQQ